MNEFLQQLINGLAVGGIYALVALGYTMVYGVLKLINFAHGDIFTIGAYLGMTLLVSGGLSGSMTPVLAVGLVVIIVFGLVALLGVALERVAYRPLRKANRLAAVVSALGASIVFQNAVMLIYGARVYVYPENLIPTLTFNIFGLNVPLMRVIVIVSSLVLMLALYAFINRTRMGTAIRAVAIDQGAARLMGINVDRVISLVFFIGAVNGSHNAMDKFIRTRRRSYETLLFITTFLAVLCAYMCRYRRMRIHHIPCFLICIFNRLFRLFFRRKSSDKIT